MRVFMGIVLAHWSEHLTQAYQVYALHWPLHQARGLLGQAFPWLVHSEVLHYGYALVMLAGIWAFLPGFTGRGRTWWSVALVIQFWHHIEHALLQGQVIAGHTLFGAAQPTSINTIVFVPMMIGMFYHLFPTAHEAAHTRCSCALRLHTATT